MASTNFLKKTSSPWLAHARCAKFLSQPFHIAEQFTGIPGAYVKIADTVRAFKEIIEGKHNDDVPEQAFLTRSGSIEEVLETAEKLKQRCKSND